MARRPFFRIVVLGLADVVATYAIWVLQTYLTDVWKLDLTHAAAVVNLFEGVSMIMPVVVSYIADTCIDHFWMFLSSSICYSVGLGCLAMSTPPVFSKSTGTCRDYNPECIDHTQKILFYTSLALIAVGRSGHFTSFEPFLEQNLDTDDKDPEDRLMANLRKCMGAFAVILVLIIGAIALQFVKLPWSLRFGIPAMWTMVTTLVFLSGSCSYTYKKPGGSSFTLIFRVFVACILKIHINPPKIPVSCTRIKTFTTNCCLTPKDSDKAAVVLPSPTLEEQERNRWRLCGVTEVEETKKTIRVLPMLTAFIFCGIVMSIGNTYFPEQANNMNPKVGKLKFPLQILLAFCHGAKFGAISLYKCVRKFMPEFSNPAIRKSAPAIGFGIAMIFSILCCIAAAKVETRRRDVILKHGLLDKPDERIPMSIFWLVPQFMLLGILDGLANESISSFFDDQIPESMRAYMILFAGGVMGAGVIGGVLSVSLAGKVSKMGGQQSWFQETLNRSRLDKYYWTLAVMSSVNLVLYIFVAIWCRSRETTMDKEDEPEEKEIEAPKEDARCCC